MTSKQMIHALVMEVLAKAGIAQPTRQQVSVLKNALQAWLIESQRHLAGELPITRGLDFSCGEDM